MPVIRGTVRDALEALALKLPGHFPHAGICIFQKRTVYAAPAVYAGFGIAFAFAAVSAHAVPFAAAADRRHRKRFFQKGFFFGAGKQLPPRVLRDTAKLPMIERVKIAGIYAAIAFDNKARSTAPHHRTVFRGHAHKHGDPVVKIAHRDRTALHISPVVAVKRSFEKSQIGFAAERIIPFFAVKAVKTRDKLQILIRSEGRKNGVRMPCYLTVDDGQHIDVHACLT